jgi:hypothetical protein
VSDIISETGDTLVVRGSVTLTINLKQPVVSDRNFVEVKLVGKSTEFPREHIGVYASSLIPIPPRLLYQRRNIRGSQLKVTDLSNYRGRRILVMTGTEDVDHPRKLDESIVEWLNQNGAKADFIYLGDRGIVGNGHMMMLEKNSDALAEHIVSWIENGWSAQSACRLLGTHTGFRAIIFVSSVDPSDLAQAHFRPYRHPMRSTDGSLPAAFVGSHSTGCGGLCAFGRNCSKRTYWDGILQEDGHAARGTF